MERGDDTLTLNELQQALIDEIERLAKDMELINKRGEKAELKGYQHAVPFLSALPIDFTEEELPEEESDLFPYFVTRIDTVSYHNDRADERNQAHLILLFAVYDNDAELKGYYSLTALMERVINRFQSNPVLGVFYCEKKMNMAFQEDDTYPQFFGAIEMTWILPEIDILLDEEGFW